MFERKRWKLRLKFLTYLLFVIFIIQFVATAFSLSNQASDGRNDPIKVLKLKSDTFSKDLPNSVSKGLNLVNSDLTESTDLIKEEASFDSFPVKADIQVEGWAAPSFQYRKNITIDSDNVAANLRDFPVLVVLYDNDLRYDTQVDGDDIIFIDSLNKTLDHEIEHFNVAFNGSHALLVAWIRIPFLSSDVNTTISMYYGNSTIGSQENTTGVWSDNYVGVWHLGTDLTGSSLNSPDGTNQGSIDEVGKIGRARRFDGIDDYINLGVWNPGIGSRNYSISTWVRLDTTFDDTSSESMPIFGHFYTGNYDMALTFAGTDNSHNTDGGLYSKVEGGGGFEYVDSATRSWPGTTWIHIVATNDRTNGVGLIYKDSVSEGGIGSITGIPTFGTTGDYRIGRVTLDQAADEKFSGVIDELRLFNGVMSTDWITTEYNNQHDPTNFYVVGIEEQRDHDVPSDGLEIIIDNAVYDATDEYNPGPSIVFINDSHGYLFFQKTNGGMAEIVYYKTIDNGTTWEGPVNIDCGPPEYRFRSFSCWFDQWTPNNTGTKIHIIVNSILNDQMVYNYLDTKDDTSGGGWSVIMSSGGSHNAPDGGGAVTVTTEGDIFGASWMYNGPQFAKHNTSWYDITPSYSFLNDDDDHGQLLPLSDGDVLCIYEDSTANSLYSFVYHSDLNAWDASPTFVTTIISEIEAPEDNYNNNANWGATINPNTHTIYLTLNNDVLNATGDLETWIFFDHNRSWNQKTDVVTNCGIGGDEVKPAYDISNNTLFAIYISDKTVYIKNSTDGGNTWGSEKKVSTVQAAWIALRTNFISSERLYTIYFDNENNDVYGITIADLQRGPENATVRVKVLDLDNRIVPNARVNITNAYNTAINWTQNTTITGYTTFTNLPYDYYNITVEFEDSVNSTLSFLEFSANSTYQINPKFELNIRISEFIDNDPPTIQNVYFMNESILLDNASTFFTDVSDWSKFEVLLNLTVVNITNEVVLIHENFTMEAFNGDQYYNATALDTLTHRNVQIFYNIIAIDIANNTVVTQLYSLYLGDGFPPNIVEYDVIDYGNGTLQFYANITDNMSLVMDPVVLQINDSFVDMHQNASGFWVCYIEAYYGELLNFSIYSAVDSLGNENGSKLSLTPSFHTIIPEDHESPPINEGDIIDNFITHYHGHVEIYVSVEDQNHYQSGINESSVQLHVNINGETHSFVMIESEDHYYYNFEFEYNDIIYYWITVSDYANNPNSSETRGPFIIHDNSVPIASYWKTDWGNGTVDFFAEITDWPFNDTSAYLLYTQNYFGSWTNLSMYQVSDITYFVRVYSLEYNLQNLWYYVSTVDTTQNWFNPGINQASNFTLSDTVLPEIIYSIESSTEKDGEITVFAYAIDPFGDTHYVNNSFYINFAYSGNNITIEMEYDTFYRYKTSYEFPFGEEVEIKVWVNDNAGNLGDIIKIITTSDHAPPKIKGTDAIVFQNGTVTIWAEVIDDGSGLFDDNSSVLLDYTHIHHQTETMQWNHSGNFYTYSIHGFEPGIAFYYYITAFDKSENYDYTTPQEVVIYDKTDPICNNFGYRNTTLNQYQSHLIFWAEASDPFGSIDGVNLTINCPNGKNLGTKTAKMHYNGTHYIHSITMDCNQSFNYNILLYDKAFNNLSIGEINQKTSDFQPARMVNYGINASVSNIGEILFWCKIHDPFNSHNVTLSVIDNTLDKWILIETRMISNEIHYTFMLPIEYMHNFSYYMRIIDYGVLEGYYEASIYTNSSQMFDWWEPIIHLAGIEEINRTTVLFWVNVSDWGSGVSEVYLNYEFTSPENTGGFGSDLHINRVLMTFNQTYHITELSFTRTVTFKWFIEVYDSVYHSKNSISKDYTFLLPPPSLFDFLIEAIILTVVVTVLVVSLFYLVSTTYQKRKKQKLFDISEFQQKLDSILNTYVILATTAVGLPVYSVSNIMYQSSNAIQDVLSGLSVGIDTFLESFQSDIVNYFIETDSDLFDNQTKDNIKTSVIEKNKVQIQIISSPSFRIFLFLKEKPPEYIKSTFIAIARGLEEKISLPELGVVEESFVGPIAQKVFKQHFPLTLLSPFLIDCQRLKEIEQRIKRGDPISKNISRSSLNALKRLVIIKSNLDVNIEDPQAQINLFDKSLAQNKLRDLPPLILNEALDIFKILKVKTKVVYKALWVGSSPEVNILVSKESIPREEIPIIQ
ncbi:MAG: DUF2341 domain-containing protein [Candidatus Heimdallarchaeota archaeon]|nr:MAG: DUF2341 domain-containing protein [Candidatus Heimdallarchaeota archaeon]